MNIQFRRAGVLLLLTMAATPLLSVAADRGDKTTPAVNAEAPDDPLNTAATDARHQASDRRRTVPIYVPPRRGAPLVRVGGGTRGLGDGMPYISVVTPEHTGFTGSPQPVLYWYLSEGTKTRFEFALISEQEIDPIIEVVSDEQQPGRLNSLDLAKHGVSLEPGVPYQWSVALVPDTDKRSGDIVSSGRIEYLAPSDAQRAQLAQASPEEAVAIYAREGYWYDTFARLSELIATDPANQQLLGQRAALLEQIGLGEISVNSQNGPD